MTVTIDADTARFLAKYQKLISKNDELKQKLKDMGRSGRSSSREIAAGMDVVKRGILSATKAVVGFVSGFATLGSAISMLQQIDERMSKIASLSSKSARGIQSFVQLQEPGKIRAAEAKLAQVSAKHGATPEEIGGVASTIQQLRGGNLDASLADIETAAKLQRLGVSQDTTETMATALIPKGIGLAEGSAAFYQVAQEGPLEPEDIGKVAPSMMAYKDPMMAVYAASALATEGVPKTQLQDRTKDLGLALQLDSELVKKAEKAAKKQGMSYQDLDEISQLELLKTQVKDLDRSGTLSLGEVMKAGINEQQKAQALAGAMNQLDVMKASQASARMATPNLIDAEIAKLGESHGMRLAMQEDVLEAQTAWANYLGPEGDAARAREGEKIALGARATAAGGSPFVDPESGKVGFWGRAMDKFLNAAPGQGVGAPGPVPQMSKAEWLDPQGGLGALGEKIDKLTEAIIANTQATEGNSEATGATPAAPLTVGRNTDVEP